MQKKIKIGLLGLGHLGRIHLKCILLSEKYALVGAYDPDQKAVDKAKEDFDFTVYESADSLMEACDLVDIVVPTSTHYELALKALQKGLHIFQRGLPVFLDLFVQPVLSMRLLPDFYW
jgi:predicted dehydrogenase